MKSNPTSGPLQATGPFDSFQNQSRTNRLLAYLQTRKELRHRKEKHMIMITLAPQHDDGVKMTMNQRQRFPVGPPVDIAILKLQVWKCQNSDSFQQWPTASGDEVV